MPAPICNGSYYGGSGLGAGLVLAGGCFGEGLMLPDGA